MINCACLFMRNIYNRIVQFRLWNISELIQCIHYWPPMVSYINSPFELFSYQNSILYPSNSTFSDLSKCSTNCSRKQCRHMEVERYSVPMRTVRNDTSGLRGIKGECAIQRKPLPTRSCSTVPAVALNRAGAGLFKIINDNWMYRIRSLIRRCDLIIGGCYWVWRTFRENSDLPFGTDVNCCQIGISIWNIEFIG